MVSFIVVDTNIMIDNIALLEDLVLLAADFQHILVIPQEVTRELDGLKTCGQRKLADNARKASNWLFDKLANIHPGIRAQKRDEKLQDGLRNDDAILDCCLYFQRALHTVVLLSNDRNLCVKSLAERIPTVTYKWGLKATEIAQMIAVEGDVSDMYLPDVDMEDCDMMDVDDAPILHSERITEVYSVKEQERLEGKKMETPTTTGSTLPKPAQLRFSKYKLVATLESDLYDCLMLNARTLTIYQLKQQLGENGYAHLVREDPKATPASLISTFKSHYAVFVDILSKDTLYGDSNGDVLTRPTGRSVSENFIRFWGRACLELSGNDPLYTKMYNDIIRTFNEFYTPPARKV